MVALYVNVVSLPAAKVIAVAPDGATRSLNSYPVQFVSVPDVGVPRTGVVNVCVAVHV